MKILGAYNKAMNRSDTSQLEETRLGFVGVRACLSGIAGGQILHYPILIQGTACCKGLAACRDGAPGDKSP